MEAAKLFEKGGSAKFEGSRAYENAAKSYKRNNPAGKIKTRVYDNEWTFNRLPLLL